jgi:hypothetical protein
MAAGSGLPGNMHRVPVDKAAHSDCTANTGGYYCRMKNRKKKPVAVTNRQVQQVRLTTIQLA